jgi:hypothetical protein
LLVRNNTIKKNLEENRDIAALVPEHCNVPEMLAVRTPNPGAKPAASASEVVAAAAEETETTTDDVVEGDVVQVFWFDAISVLPFVDNICK